MKEHPLLLKGPLVRATLEGRKTQTRRPIRPQPRVSDRGCPSWGTGRGNRRLPGVPVQSCGGKLVSVPDLLEGMGPLGQAGDRLWVRETWCLASAESETTPPDLRPMRGCRWCYYHATEPDVEHEEGDNRSPWRPSIHMPRWACRLVLPLVSMRVERVRDITEDDAKAEGVEPIGGSYREGFRAVLTSIYGPKAWDENWWVWVAEWEDIEVSR